MLSIIPTLIYSQTLGKKMINLAQKLTFHPLVFSITILVLLIILGKLVHILFSQWLKRVVGKTKTKLDDYLLAILEKPIIFTIILVGAYFAILPYFLSSNVQYVLQRGLISLVVVIWAVVLVKATSAVFQEVEHRQIEEHKQVSTGFVPFFNNIFKVVIFGFTLFFILTSWGVDVTPLIASAGVVGVAIAFAAKDTVANLFGGVSVFFDKPYKVGDYVLIDEKYRGEVIEIGMRSTKIKTRDNILLTVPNSVMITGAVINETGFDPKLRIRIPLSISYESDLDRVEEILVDLFKKYPNIIQKPEPRVRYRQFSPSAIDLEVLGVIGRPADRGKVIHQLMKEIHKRFKKEKIEMPYPQRKVHLYRKS